MATLNIIKGTVKYAAGPARETTNGPRINVVVTLTDGEETKLWGDPGDPSLTPLKKGNAVQLVKNAKGTGYSLLDTSPTTPAAPPVPELSRVRQAQPRRAAKAPAPGNSPRQQTEVFKPWTDEEKKQLASNSHYGISTSVRRDV